MEELWQEIWQTISRNKWRSLMTAFGVFWGILMLVLLVGLGHGVFNGIVSAFNSIPSNSLVLGGGSTSIPYRGLGRDRYISMDNSDIELLREELKGKARYVTPFNNVSGMTVNRGEYNFNSRIVGTTEGYYSFIPQKLLYGRYINEVDLRERRKVCVIGLQVYESLYPQGGDPCGQIIHVGEVYYTIVGVTKKLTNIINVGTDVDRAVILPFSTCQLAYGQGKDVYMTIVTLEDNYSLDVWEEKILAIVKEKHIVHPDDKTAFWSFNLSEIISMFGNLFLGINILLWIVGCGSLFAGLIGISNIMLVTVKERTQEIGIRRALGARPLTILTQILAESLVLTVAAGITGLLLGVWILNLVGMISAASGDSSDFKLSDPQIDFSVAISAFVVIMIGGLLAGWMPARRAMKIKAIEALRDE